MLEKRRYIKTAIDDTNPLYNDQLILDELHDKLYEMNKLYNHRINDLPPGYHSLVAEIRSVEDNIHTKLLNWIAE